MLALKQIASVFMVALTCLRNPRSCSTSTFFKSYDFLSAQNQSQQHYQALKCLQHNARIKIYFSNLTKYDRRQRRDWVFKEACGLGTPETATQHSATARIVSGIALTHPEESGWWCPRGADDRKLPLVRGCLRARSLYSPSKSYSHTLN